MNEKNFSEEDFRGVLVELFEVDQAVLTDEYDLSHLIKDSIDLGELVAILKSRYGVEPKDWECFKTETQFQRIFTNFE